MDVFGGKYHQINRKPTSRTAKSGPRGTEIKRLAAMAQDMGCVVESVDYTNTMDPDLPVERLLQVLARETRRIRAGGFEYGWLRFAGGLRNC